MSDFENAEHEVLAVSDDGLRRVLLVQDSCPLPPEDEYHAPFIRVEHRWGRADAEPMNGYSGEHADAYNRFHQSDLHDPEAVFERWLRIFHGTRTVISYGPNNYTDYKYICFDTDYWARSVGCPDGKRANGADLGEYIAYLENDVYGLVSERLVGGACGHAECEEHTKWETDDSIWGFYGDNEYTRRAHREYFAGI